MESVAEIIRKAESNYIHGTAKIGDHVNVSMHEDIEKILAYVNSKFTTGDTDSLGREKPFFNIVTAAINVWYRATMIRRKSIIVSPDKTGNVLAAFLATIKLREWMKTSDLGQYLSKWGRTLAIYGSAVTKTVEKDGKLIMDVVPWSKMICDPQDFDALPRIEKLFLTPYQLQQNKNYNQDVVKNLIEARSSRQTIGKQSEDNMNEFIPLYEVHGTLSQAVYKKAKGEEPNEEDDKLFFQQMHVVSYVSKGKGRKQEYDDFTVYCGKEAKDPYDKDDLIEEDSQTLSYGAVRNLFQAQWMANHGVKAIKDTIDITGKIVFQTADKRFLNKNILRELETGDILYHEFNKPLTQVNNSKGDITYLQNFITQWRVLAQEINSTPDSALSKAPPASQPWSTTALINQESNSLFEVMIENKALALEKRLRERVIPFLKKQLDTDEEVLATLEDHEIKKIDAMYLPVAAIKNYNDRTIEDILNLKPAQPFDMTTEQINVKQSLAPLGNKRGFKPTVVKDGKEIDVSWKEVIKDIEWELDIDIAGESKEKQAILATLDNTFRTIVSLAGRPMTTDERMLFDKIMNEAGVVSPLELSMAGSEAPIVPPIEAGVPTGRAPVEVNQ